MKRLTNRSFILPYILILAGSVSLSALLIPPTIHSAYTKAAESGLPPDFTLVYLGIGAIMLIALLAAIIASGIYSAPSQRPIHCALHATVPKPTTTNTPHQNIAKP